MIKLYVSHCPEQERGTMGALAEKDGAPKHFSIPLALIFCGGATALSGEKSFAMLACEVFVSAGRCLLES